MKKNIFLLMGIAAMLTACENNDECLTAYNGKQTVTFSVQGDFDCAAFEYGGVTRAALSADGKQMTDLWVFDYQNGLLVQQLHQVSTDEDFGEPTLNLSMGDHHVYFVVSRGEGVTLSTTAHKLTWTKPLDTFWKDYTVSVTNGTASTHNVALDRVSTKLTISILDEIPAGIANITMTPTTWYNGLDYTTGNPTDAMTSEPRQINISSNYIGTSGLVSTSIYGFSGSTQWTADVNVVARDGSNNVIGQAEITNAPFTMNRVTIYSGNLFINDGGFSLSLNANWADDYAGTW